MKAYIGWCSYAEGGSNVLVYQSGARIRPLSLTPGSDLVVNRLADVLFQATRNDEELGGGTGSIRSYATVRNVPSLLDSRSLVQRPHNLLFGSVE